MRKTPAEGVCDEEIFSDLFRKLAHDLHSHLYYKYGVGNNPKDIVQEAFRKLWENCRKVSKEKAKSFLYTVANNHVLNDIARKKVSFRYNAETQNKVSTHESPEYLMEEEQYRQKVHTALESLSEEQRTTLMLNRVEGKKHQEIADILGISKKAVEKRIYTALSILRKKIGNI